MINSESTICHYRHNIYHNHIGHYDLFIGWFISYMGCLNVLYDTWNIPYDISNVSSFYLYLQCVIGGLNIIYDKLNIL